MKRRDQLPGAPGLLTPSTCPAAIMKVINQCGFYNCQFSVVDGRISQADLHHQYGSGQFGPIIKA